MLSWRRKVGAGDNSLYLRPHRTHFLEKFSNFEQKVDSWIGQHTSKRGTECHNPNVFFVAHTFVEYTYAAEYTFAEHTNTGVYKSMQLSKSVIVVASGDWCQHGKCASCKPHQSKAKTRGEEENCEDFFLTLTSSKFVPGIFLTLLGGSFEQLDFLRIRVLKKKKDASTTTHLCVHKNMVFSISDISLCNIIKT